MNTGSKSCGNCKWSEYLGPSRMDGMECRRHPPTAMWDKTTTHIRRAWPPVAFSDWCGEYTYPD